MTDTEAKLIIINVLQDALTGELKSFSKFSPQFVADAVLKKVELGRTYSESKGKKINEITESMEISINSFKDSMEDELSILGSDEKLLANFIRGKLTAYQEILETINNL